MKKRTGFALLSDEERREIASRGGKASWEKKTDEEKRRPRGFATLPPERHHEISVLGGKAAHASGKAHKFTSEKAREAGKLGGRRKKIT